MPLTSKLPRVAWAAFGAVLVLTIAACGGGVRSGASSSTSHFTSTSSKLLPRPELAHVTMGVLVETGIHAAEIAIEHGLFKKYGLNATIDQFTNQSDLDSAMLAGQIDIVLTGAANAIMASQLTDIPTEGIFVGQTDITDNLWVSKSITKPQQLIGKAIAISSFGSTTYGESLITLKALGLKPSQVTITQVGDDAARQAALFSGAVAASFNDRAEEPLMKAHGMHSLFDLANPKHHIGLPSTMAVVTNAFARKNPNTVLAAVAGLLEGTHLFLTKPQLAIQAAVKFEHISYATAKANVDYDLNGWTPDNGIAPLSMWKADEVFFAKLDPSLAAVNLKKTFDAQFLTQLKSIGFDKIEKIPTS